MTQVEAAAGLDPDGIAADHDDAVSSVTSRWGAVLRDQRADLAAQVAAAVDSGNLAILAGLTAPDAGGTAILTDAMTDHAWQAARRVCQEAASQRVFIDTAKIMIDGTRIGHVAATRAALAGQHLARAAVTRALVVASAPVAASEGDDAAEQVTITLAGLSDASLADQLGAAMTTAGNEGRTAAFTTADDDPDTPQATYVATEILDQNTCGPCAEVDGTEFADLDEAMDAYSNGAYVNCEGELRCRGTYIASWPDVTVTARPPDQDGGDGGLPDLPAPDSMSMWQRPDGSWDPARQELHDDIVDGLLQGYQPQDDPVAYFLGGGPASGKSSLPRPGGGLGPVIDPDAIKALLPEYQAMTAAGDLRAAAFVHEESSAVAAQARGEAASRKLSYVVDGTGDSSYAKMAAKVNAARAAGARVEADYVTVDTDEAIARATARAAATGRMVPAPVIRAIHASVTDVVTQAVSKGLFDELRLWDNNGAAPVLIATAGKTTGLQVLDQDAYDRFTAKSPAAAPAPARPAPAAPVPLVPEQGPPGENRTLDFASEVDAEAVASRFRAALATARAVAAGAVARPASDSPFDTGVLLLADDVAAQVDVQDLLDRIDTGAFGTPDFPYPFEFSGIGWVPGAETWVGKELMDPAASPPAP